MSSSDKCGDAINCIFPLLLIKCVIPYDISNNEDDEKNPTLLLYKFASFNKGI